MNDQTSQELDEVVRLNPEDATVYLNRGDAYNKKSDYDKAIADYDKAIQLNPNDDKAYNNRGIAYDEKGEYDKAIADYSKAIELDPEYAKAYYNRGYAYYEKDEYDKAIADYNKAIELDPNNAEAYNNRGYTCYKKGEYDRAIIDYDKAIELDPKCATAYYNRGAAYKEKGEYDKAIADYDKAIELNPEYATAYNDRGVAYHFTKVIALGMLALSIFFVYLYLTAIRSLINLESVLVAVFLIGFSILGIRLGIIKKFKFDKVTLPKWLSTGAVDVARRFKFDVFNSPLKYVGGKVFNKPLRDFVSIINGGLGIEFKSDKFILGNPHAMRYHGRGIHYFDIGEFDKAIEYFNKAIRFDPESAIAYYNRGYTYSEKGEYDRAIDDYNKAVVLKPDHALIYLSRGSVYHNIGNYEQAVEDYDNTVRLCPDYETDSVDQGYVYGGHADSDRARKLLEKVVNDYGQSENLAAAAYYSGVSNLFSGNPHAARENFVEALELGFNEKVKVDKHLENLRWLISS